MHRALARVIPAAVGGVAGAVSYLLGSTQSLLTGAIVLSYALLARIAISHPDIVYEEGSSVWAVGRWSGLSTGFILVVVLFGVSSALPIEIGLLMSLQILVFGAGWTMWALGVAYAREKGV